jgi:hypothetical protein
MNLSDDEEAAGMICPLTGQPHQLFEMRSAVWCWTCRQKIESCCEGNTPSLLGSQDEDEPSPWIDSTAEWDPF